MERSVWFFIYFYAGFTFELMSILVGLDESYIRAEVIHTRTSLYYYCVRNLLKPPSLDSLLASVPADFAELYPNTVAVAVDGTNINIYRPQGSSSARPLYAPKYSSHCYRFSILVDLAGRIVNASGICKGSENDKTAFDKAEFATLVHNTYNRDLEQRGLNFAFLGDKAYPVAKLPESDRYSWLITMSGAKKLVKAAEINGTRVHAAQEIAPFRAVVERTFTVLKKWARLSFRKTICIGEDDMTEVFCIASAIFNYKLDLKSM